MSAVGVVAPASVEALHALLAGASAPLHFIAGGTDMLIAGRPLPEEGLLVDLSRVGGLAFVETEGPDIRIGAATTVATLAGHVGLAARLPALCQAAAQCGSVQIRNRATIGGNIANAAPAADLVPVLLAVEAGLGLLQPGGRRCEAPLASYRVRPGELITEIVIPGDALLSASAFAKLGPRRELAISRISLALAADLEDNRFGVVRIAAGAIGPAPRRLPLAEAALTGRQLEAATLRDFVPALAADVDAAIPGRTSQPYKRRAIAGLGLDLVARAAGLDPRAGLFEGAFE